MRCKWGWHQNQWICNRRVDHIVTDYPKYLCLDAHEDGELHQLSETESVEIICKQDLGPVTIVANMLPKANDDWKTCVMWISGKQ